MYIYCIMFYVSLGAKMLNQPPLVLTPLWSSALASCSTDNKFPLQITCITLSFMFTTSKFEGYHKTCLKYPPSKCMYVVSHVIKSCHCIHPSLFLISTGDSFMVSAKWCPPPGLPPSHSQNHATPERAWVSQSIFLHNFCSKIHHFSVKM